MDSQVISAGLRLPLLPELTSVVERVKGESVMVLIMWTALACVLLQLAIRLVRLIWHRHLLWNRLKHFPGPEMAFLQRELVKRETWLKTSQGFEQYGPVSRLTVTPLNTYIRLVHPAFIECVTRTAEPKPTQFRQLFYRWIGDGLLLSAGKKWARNRRLLTPTFHFDILKDYLRVFNDKAHILTNKWLEQAAGGELRAEMFEHVSQMTLDSILECAFGCSPTSQRDGSPYLRAVRQLAELLANRIRRPMQHFETVYNLTSDGQKYRQACSRIHKFSQAVIKERRAALGTQQAASKKMSFLDLILTAKDGDGNGLTDTEIQHECDTFMFEGHDTTASAISWCLYNLATHPQYQERCRQEVDALMDDKPDSVISWDDLSKLTFLTQCVKESLRMHPPVPTIMRQLTADITLPDGRVLPAGATVIISIYGCHHHSEIWENPDVFDPERFGDSAPRRHALSFIPFSAGPRNCIGQHFAMNEVKVAVAHILRHFILSPDDSRPSPQPIPALILCSKGGVWLRMQPRTGVTGA